MISAIHPPETDPRLAAIVESSDDAIIAKDLQGGVFAWNKAAERMFGYTAAEMIGQPITVIFPTSRIAEEGVFLARIAAGERVDHYETERRHKDGKSISVSVTISPIRDAAGVVIGASKILRDLTDRNARAKHVQQLQAELAHVQRLNELGQMVASLIHEVNQPLTAIGNYAAAGHLAPAGGDQELLRTALNHIATEAARTREIVRRIDNFVRRREVEMRAEDLGLVIDEAVALATTFVRDSRLALTVILAPQGLRVLIDKIQVQQVLFNLLRNGIEAMQNQARHTMVIAARPGPPDMVEISVADSGEGLAEDVRSKLFEPFFTTKGYGMGMGLSVCRSIVQAHTGRLWAEDNPRRRGGVSFYGARCCLGSAPKTEGRPGLCPGARNAKSVHS